MKKFIQDFKEFAVKGNVIDMAVGVVIGGAFGKIVTSLVQDIIMPLVTLLTGALTFTDLKFVIKEAGEGIEPIAIMYGNFMQNVIDFFIISLCIFCVLKVIMKLKKEKPVEEEKPAEPAGPTTEELLVEIRDLLKDKK